MLKLQQFTAQVRSAARRGVAWALWSRRNAVITVAGIAAFILVVFIVASTSTVVDISRAVPRPAAPTTNALDGFTTKPRNPSELATGEVGKLVPKEGTRGADSIDQTSGKFMTLWLAGYGKTEQDRAAWVETLSPYVTYAMRDQLAGTDMAAIPAATVAASDTTNLLDSATTTFTLSTGQIVAVQMMHNAGSWMVRGLVTGTP